LEGTPVIARSHDNQTFPAVYRNGGAIIHPKAAGDGSIILATDYKTTRKHVSGRLQSQGISEVELAATLNLLFDKDTNQSITVARTRIDQWDVKSIDIGVAGKPMSHVVPFKIAYEYLTLHLGVGVFDPFLATLRESLQKNEVPDSVRVLERHADEYQPVHRIAIEGTPRIVVHVCLFGWRIYTVTFTNLIWGGPCYAYSLQLDTGKEDVWEIFKETNADKDTASNSDAEDSK
jgi:hypothetical protein